MVPFMFFYLMHKPNYVFCLYTYMHKDCFFRIRLNIFLLVVIHDWVWEIESDVSGGELW